MNDNDDSVCIETQFEVFSARVKGIAFHPTEPLILSSLHTPSGIQLWNYEIGQLVNEWMMPHNGPIRAIDFNPNTARSEFATGGDDYVIKIWNYRTFLQLYELPGHRDYIRVIKYCPSKYNKPWFISCSDDQTIRIWDYNLLTTIAVISDHSHYVMGIDWHPNNVNLICSACLDRGVRIFDISKLCNLYDNDHEKYLEIYTKSDDNNTNTSTRWLSKLTPNTYLANKHTLKLLTQNIHSRGVDAVNFHPFRNLIISGADDFNVALGVYTNDNFNILNIFNGHLGNITGVKFAYDPELKCDIIVSVGEDGNIFVWQCRNFKNQQILKWNFTRSDGGRYWTLSHHPTLNLFAAGHDGGFVIFKIIRKKYIKHIRDIKDISDDNEYEICVPEIAQKDIDNQLYISYDTDEESYCGSDVGINGNDDVLNGYHIKIWKRKCNPNNTFLINIIRFLSLSISLQMVVFLILIFWGDDPPLYLLRPLIWWSIIYLIFKLREAFMDEKISIWTSVIQAYFSFLCCAYFNFNKYLESLSYKILDVSIKLHEREWTKFNERNISIDVHCFNIALLQQAKHSAVYNEYNESSSLSNVDLLDHCINGYWKCIRQKTDDFECNHCDEQYMMSDNLKYNLNIPKLSKMTKKVKAQVYTQCASWILCNLYWIWFCTENWLYLGIKVPILGVVVICIIMMVIGIHILTQKLYSLKDLYLYHPLVLNYILMSKIKYKDDHLMHNELFYKNYKFLLKSALSIETIKQCIGHRLITNLIIEYLPFNNFNPVNPEFVVIRSADIKDKKKEERKYFKKITSLINKVNSKNITTTSSSRMIRDCVDEMLEKSSGYNEINIDDDENDALLQQEETCTFETINPGFDTRHYN